jgi:hypothetical protein
MHFLRITLTNIEIASIDQTSPFYFSMTILELKNKPLSVGEGLKNIVKLWKLRDISVITLKFVRNKNEDIMGSSSADVADC